MAGTYVLQKSSSSQFWWVLRSGNSETILTSEMYNSKQGALNGIESCRVNSPSDGRYRRFNDTAGNPRFSLHGANGEIIGASEGYISTAGRENGIGSCKANGPTAVLDDRT